MTTNNLIKTQIKPCDRARSRSSRIPSTLVGFLTRSRETATSAWFNKSSCSETKSWTTSSERRLALELTRSCSRSRRCRSNQGVLARCSASSRPGSATQFSCVTWRQNCQIDKCNKPFKINAIMTTTMYRSTCNHTSMSNPLTSAASETTTPSP